MCNVKLYLDIYGSHVWVNTHENLIINRLNKPLNFIKDACKYKAVITCTSLAMLDNVANNEYINIATYNSKE